MSFGDGDFAPQPVVSGMSRSISMGSTAILRHLPFDRSVPLGDLATPLAHPFIDGVRAALSTLFRGLLCRCDASFAPWLVRTSVAYRDGLAANRTHPAPAGRYVSWPPLWCRVFPSTIMTLYVRTAALRSYNSLPAHRAGGLPVFGYSIPHLRKSTPRTNRCAGGEKAGGAGARGYSPYHSRSVLKSPVPGEVRSRVGEGSLPHGAIGWRWSGSTRVRESGTLARPSLRAIR